MSDALRLLLILVVVAICTSATFAVQLRISDKSGVAASVGLTVSNVLMWACVASVVAMVAVHYEGCGR